MLSSLPLIKRMCTEIVLANKVCHGLDTRYHGDVPWRCAHTVLTFMGGGISCDLLFICR